MENFGMTFPKKGHAESQKIVGMEVNQHSGKTLANHSNAITSLARKHKAKAPYMHVLNRFGH
jgi:hypothetical protein